MRFEILPVSLLFVLFLTLSTLMGLSLRESAAAGRGLFILLAFSALARGLSPGDGRIFAWESLSPSALYALRLGTIFIVARLFYTSTRVSELGDYFSVAYRLLRGYKVAPASHAAPGHDEGAAASPRSPKADRSSSLAADPGMMLTLSLVFIPRTFENYRRIREAAECRGFGVRKKRLFSGLELLQALLFSSIKNSLKTAEAMEARAYSPERRIIVSDLRSADILLMVSGLGMAILSFI
jgi:energy-coupling factor transporter transmembrane protein EcfT